MRNKLKSPEDLSESGLYQDDIFEDLVPMLEAYSWLGDSGRIHVNEFVITQANNGIYAAAKQIYDAVTSNEEHVIREAGLAFTTEANLSNDYRVYANEDTLLVGLRDFLIARYPIDKYSVSGIVLGLNQKHAASQEEQESNANSNSSPI